MGYLRVTRHLLKNFGRVGGLTASWLKTRPCDMYRLRDDQSCCWFAETFGESEKDMQTNLTNCSASTCAQRLTITICENSVDRVDYWFCVFGIDSFTSVCHFGCTQTEELTQATGWNAGLTSRERIFHERNHGGINVDGFRACAGYKRRRQGIPGIIS